jgi:small subunit ribosomal protein S17
MDEAINNQETPVNEGAPTNETAAQQASQTRGRRAEKIGIVTSDKMTKTVVVRVDRLVKHPIYKRYIRKRSKFMAHNEIEGVSTGDQVRIVETRPLSARKRWRVVEVLRKVSK